MGTKREELADVDQQKCLMGRLVSFPGRIHAVSSLSAEVNRFSCSPRPETLRLKPEARSLAPRRYFHTVFLREPFRLFVACVHMPDHAHSRISRQNAFDAPGHHVATVGHRDLSRV
jgi:hypothetical protein